MYPILQYPDPRLSQAGQVVTDFSDATQIIIDNMIETHYAQKNCAALAATQLGIPLQITVIDFSEEKNDLLVLVNPVLTPVGTQTTCTKEGCMSVGLYTNQHIQAKVERAETILVKAQDRYGQPIEFEADGFLAKCIQHECDHLHGKIFLDHLKQVTRQILEKKIRK
ncbi:MAG: peptide deformylase [Legionellales bacterium]|nr:peptide deformylase [Legionellales bacterium]